MKNSTSNPVEALSPTEKKINKVIQKFRDNVAFSRDDIWFAKNPKKDEAKKIIEELSKINLNKALLWTIKNFDPSKDDPDSQLHVTKKDFAKMIVDAAIKSNQELEKNTYEAILGYTKGLPLDTLSLKHKFNEVNKEKSKTLTNEIKNIQIQNNNVNADFIKPKKINVDNINSLHSLPSNINGINILNNKEKYDIITKLSHEDIKSNAGNPEWKKNVDTLLSDGYDYAESNFGEDSSECQDIVIKYELLGKNSASYHQQ